MRQLRPTHRCFDDALEFINERVVANDPAADRLVLCHGIALAPANGPKPNHPFAHAWVDAGEEIWQAAILDDPGHEFHAQRIFYSVTPDEFHTLYRPQDITRYTVRQAAQMNLQHGTLGPWEPRYRALCSTQRLILGSTTVERKAPPT